MTENKRFTLSQNGTFHTVRDNVENKPLGVFEFKDNEFPVYACFHMIIDLMNDLSEDNEYLEKRFKEEEWHYNHIDEDRDVWKHKCQELKKENEELKAQLDYVQNSISEHIKHQKTELGQKALREVIQDYNDWLLGHKEVIE